LTIHRDGVSSNLAEKWKPTYDLDAFKAACSSVERLRVTTIAV